MQKSQIYTLLSLVCLGIPLAMLGTWRYVFNSSALQYEQIHGYSAYVPEIIQNITISTLFSMVLCGAAIFFAIIGDTTTTESRKGVHFWVMVFAVCVLALNGLSLFQM